MIVYAHNSLWHHLRNASSLPLAEDLNMQRWISLVDRSLHMQIAKALPDYTHVEKLAAWFTASEQSGARWQAALVYDMLLFAYSVDQSVKTKWYRKIVQLCSGLESNSEGLKAANHWDTPLNMECFWRFQVLVNSLCSQEEQQES